MFKKILHYSAIFATFFLFVSLTISKYVYFEFQFKDFDKSNVLGFESYIAQENPTCYPDVGGCGDGHYWNYDTCICEQYETSSSSSSCETTSQGCESGWYWDVNSCQCVKEQSTCTEPSGGCDADYYWDFDHCTCTPNPSCTAPPDGCMAGYYWDSYYCSCKPSPTTCTAPQDGCGINHYWDSSTCSCVFNNTSSCYPPDGGCPVNYHWNYTECSCVYDTTTYCTQPSGGCPAGYYWDSYYCSCRSDTVTCKMPDDGCPSGYYWDSYKCSCKPNEDYCTQPPAGCGEGYYWNNISCDCESTYATTSIGGYSDEDFDRLAYESKEIISCVRSKLTDSEYKFLRYTIADTVDLRNKIYALYEKVQKCWNTQTTTTQSPSVTTAGDFTQKEQCLINAIGTNAYKDISFGQREPSYEEHLWFEKCYGQVERDSINYVSDLDDIPNSIESCLQNTLSTDLYTLVINGKKEVPLELRKKVDRCFGVDSQPFEVAPAYKIPNEVKSCLIQVVGQERFNQINQGMSQPTNEEKLKAEACFSKINKKQKNLLPPPPEEVPYLEEDNEKIKFADIVQDTKVSKNNKKTGGKIVFKGKGPANSVVNIYIYSDPIVVTTKTDENGDWVYELNKPLKGEKHIAYATVKSEEGKVIRSSVFDFQVLAASSEPITQPFISEYNATLVQNNFAKYSIIALAIITTIVSSAIFYINFKNTQDNTSLNKLFNRKGKDDSGSSSIN